MRVGDNAPMHTPTNTQRQDVATDPAVNGVAGYCPRCEVRTPPPATVRLRDWPTHSCGTPLEIVIERS